MKKHLLLWSVTIASLVVHERLCAAECEQSGRISLISSRELTPESVEVITEKLFERGALSYHGYGFSRVKSGEIAESLNKSLDWADRLTPTPEYPTIEPNAVIVIKKADDAVISVSMSVTLEEKLFMTLKRLWHAQDEQPVQRNTPPIMMDGPELTGQDGEQFFMEMDSDE